MKITNWQACECHGLHNCPSLNTRDDTKAATVNEHPNAGHRNEGATMQDLIVWNERPSAHFTPPGSTRSPFAAPITSADIAARITADYKRILLAGGAK